MRTIFYLPVLLLGVLLGSCSDPAGTAPVVSRVFTMQPSEGWTAGWADLPSPADTVFYELQGSYRPLPTNLGATPAYYICGNNHSDDLFMYLSTRMDETDNLQPNTSYRVSISIDFASCAGSGCAGAGGTPGEGVIVKAGVSTVEPAVQVDNEGWLRMNIDKGQQTMGGSDAPVLGDIANGSNDCSLTVFLMKQLTAEGYMTVTTGDDAELWLIVGTDSAFEALTELYYRKIEVTLEPD
jgi:hypothetical protein